MRLPSRFLLTSGLISLLLGVVVATPPLRAQPADLTVAGVTLTVEDLDRAVPFYRDPTGNPLELIHYPPDKGRSRWHWDADSLFLGIDHTALAVVDTERSLAFYRDHLGFQVAGGSANVGPEQERLTGAFGARVQITALRPPNGGIGIELLEYQSPGTGQPFPRDTKASDRWHAHVHLQTAHLDETADALLDANTAFVSPGLVSLPASALGVERAEYGAIFLPQVGLAIVGSIGGGTLAQRWGFKSLLLFALGANAVSQLLLAATVWTGSAWIYPAVLAGTASRPSESAARRSPSSRCSAFPSPYPPP